MTFNFPAKLVLAAFALSCSSALTAVSASAAVAPPYGSNASVGTMSLSVLGKSVGGTPVGEASGVGAPAYDQKQMVLGLKAVVALPSLPGVTPLQVVLSTPASQSRARGHRFTDRGDYHAVSQSFNRTVSMSIQSANPLIPLNLLTIGTGFLTTTATADTTPTGQQTNTTLAKTSGINISGLLIGGKSIVLKGVITPGVIFSSPLITITADEVSTGMSHGVTAVSINALDIAVHGALVAGLPVTGHILLGSASAY